MSHTKGPWKLERYLTTTPWTINAPDGEHIATVYLMDGEEAKSDEEAADEGEANARLIAAAPDLLEALKAMLPLAFHYSVNLHGIASEAIAKAEGKS